MKCLVYSSNVFIPWSEEMLQVNSWLPCPNCLHFCKDFCAMQLLLGECLWAFNWMPTKCVPLHHTYIHTCLKMPSPSLASSFSPDTINLVFGGEQRLLRACLWDNECLKLCRFQTHTKIFDFICKQILYASVWDVWLKRTWAMQAE